MDEFVVLVISFTRPVTKTVELPVIKFACPPTMLE